MRSTPVGGVGALPFQPKTSVVSLQDRIRWAYRMAVTVALIGFGFGLLNAHLQDVSQFEGRFTTLALATLLGLVAGIVGFTQPKMLNRVILQVRQQVDAYL